MHTLPKKILALALSLLIAFSMGLTALAVVSGDMNSDNKVSAADARLILRCAVGLEDITSTQMTAGDLNMDGQITATDARTALRISVGLDVCANALLSNEFEIIRSGFFMADVTMTESGVSQKVKMAVTDKSTYILMNVSEGDELFKEIGMAVKLEMLFNDQGSYLLDSKNKQYAKFPYEDLQMDEAEFKEAMTAGAFDFASSLKDTGLHSTEEYNGVSCTVHTFNITGNNDKVIGTMKVYMHGKKLVALREYDLTGRESLTYTFNSISMAIPVEYTKISPSYTEAEDAIEMLLIMIFGEELLQQ